MNKSFNTTVEVGSKTVTRQGLTSTYPKAVVTINTDDEDFHLLILTSLALVENLEAIPND